MARYLRIALFAACVALMLTTSMGAPQPNGRFRPISISSLRTTTSTTPRTTSTTRRHSGHPYPDPYPFPAPAYLYLQRGDAQRMQVGGPKDIGHSPLTTKRTTTSTTRRGPGGNGAVQPFNGANVKDIPMSSTEILSSYRAMRIAIRTRVRPMRHPQPSLN